MLQPTVMSQEPTCQSDKRSNDDRRNHEGKISSVVSEPEAERDGVADVRRAEETRCIAEVHGRSSRNGLLEVQVQLIG